MDFTGLETPSSPRSSARYLRRLQAELSAGAQHRAERAQDARTARRRFLRNWLAQAPLTNALSGSHDLSTSFILPKVVR